jgi:hypothetical protein
MQFTIILLAGRGQTINELREDRVLREGECDLPQGRRKCGCAGGMVRRGWVAC